MKAVKKTEITKSDAQVRKNMKDYDNDPYFIKKDEEAKRILRKVGIPGNKNLHFL